jgi:hypothetical protein
LGRYRTLKAAQEQGGGERQSMAQSPAPSGG